MKKILIGFNVFDRALNVIYFAIKFAENNSASIHAVFLKPGKEGINSDYFFPNDLSMAEDLKYGESVSENNAELINDNIQLLKDKCEAKRISFSSEKNITTQELIEKTSKVDLFITDSQSSFIDKILPHTYCPSFLAAGNEWPQNIILMYDNSSPGNLAIEKYISLFPEFKDLPTYFLSINLKEESEKEKKIFFNEKLDPALNDVVLTSLQGNAVNEMKNFLAGFSGPVVIVMKDFNQRPVKGLFNKSLATIARNKKNTSLFIVKE